MARRRHVHRRERRHVPHEKKGGIFGNVGTGAGIFGGKAKKSKMKIW